MLLYAFVILVVIICLILYKFFSVIESLVNQYSSDGKKEKFSNFNEDNISIKTMLKKEVQHHLLIHSPLFKKVQQVIKKWIQEII